MPGRIQGIHFLAETRCAWLYLSLTAALHSWLLADVARSALVDLTPAGGNGAVSTTSASLAELLADPAGGVIVGKAIFTEFSYSALGDLPDAASVAILGVQDASGNWGIQFSGEFVDLGSGGSSSGTLGFRVTLQPEALEHGRPILGATLSLGDVAIGSDSLVTVDGAATGQAAVLNAYATSLGPVPSQRLDDAIAIEPSVTELVVRTDLLMLTSPDATTAAAMHTLTQTVVQNLIAPPGPDGDFNDDGVIDFADLARWSERFGVDGAADADGDGDSDGADFLLWQEQLNAAPVAAVVPEPSGLTIALLAAGTAIVVQRGRGRTGSSR